MLQQGSLQRRIERSRYYTQQFNSLLPDLRIRRIEGWQPYDQFVQRRLGGNYRFIDIVGQRYDRVTAKIDRFRQQLNAAETDKQTKAIADQATATARQTKATAKLQAGAEKAFWFVLLPYYFSNFWVEALEDLSHAHLLEEEWVSEHRYWIRGISFLIGLAGGWKKSRDIANEEVNSENSNGGTHETNSDKSSRVKAYYHKKIESTKIRLKNEWERVSSTISTTPDYARKKLKQIRDHFNPPEP